VPNFDNNNEKEVLLNALTIGKIVQVNGSLSLNGLRKIYNINIEAGEIHDKIPLITIEIGTFEDLFAPAE
jgi:hypothetical protein